MATSVIKYIPKIVDQGTSNGWYYRKWSDGTAECWRRFAKDVAANTVDSTAALIYPFTFSELPTAQMTLLAGGADLYSGHLEKSGTTASQMRIVLINKHTATVAMEADLYVIGKV